MAELVTQGVPARAKLSHLRGNISPSPTSFNQISRTLIELVTNFLGVKNNDLDLCYHSFSNDACPHSNIASLATMNYWSYTTCPRPQEEGVHRGGDQLGNESRVQ